MEVSDPLYATPLYPRGRSPRYPLERRLDGPRAGLDAAVAKRKKSHVIQLRFVIRSACIAISVIIIAASVFAVCHYFVNILTFLRTVVFNLSTLFDCNVWNSLLCYVSLCHHGMARSCCRRRRRPPDMEGSSSSLGVGRGTNKLLTVK
jgi:hypothetical protein